MLAGLAAWAASQGAHTGCLQVQAGNAPAERLYEAIGFSRELYRYRYLRAPEGGDQAKPSGRHPRKRPRVARSARPRINSALIRDPAVGTSKLRSEAETAVRLDPGSPLRYGRDDGRYCS
jgi:hypothetical protein